MLHQAQEEEAPANNAFEHVAAILEDDGEEDPFVVEEAQVQKARAEVNGFKQVQLLSDEQTRERDFLISHKKAVEQAKHNILKQEKNTVVRRYDAKSELEPVIPPEMRAPPLAETVQKSLVSHLFDMTAAPKP